MKQMVSRCETLSFSVRNKLFPGMKQLTRLNECTVLDLVDNFACYT